MDLIEIITRKIRILYLLTNKSPNKSVCQYKDYLYHFENNIILDISPENGQCCQIIKMKSHKKIIIIIHVDIRLSFSLMCIN